MSGSTRFVCLFYAITIVFILSVCWLFLSNIGYTDTRSVLELFGRPWFWKSVKLSLLTSFVTTIIAICVGIPASYALSRFNIPGKTIIDIVFASVIVLPASTIGLCLMVAFQYEPILKIQQALGFRVVHSIPSIIIAQLVLALAFGIKAWRVAFDDVNPRYEHVARSLGSSRMRTFWKVTLPLAKEGILAGIILAWTRAMAEFGAVLLFSSTFRNRHETQFSHITKFLGIDRADILPVGMWMEIEGGNIEQGIAIGFVLVIITFMSVYTLNKISGKGLQARKI
ncbi:MAG: ABC transporter permease subunit [Candidatus Kuenenia sp.]|nr:ABC transporter permease subunit [Candidatus Kuenenia hertensis]